MIQYHFTCELLSDVIISSASTTEGFHPSLDYIPGAKFWGIAAQKLYSEANASENLNLFHNGQVQFGDAHLIIDGKRSHKIPLSWFKDKHKPETGTYLHHAVDYEKLIEEGVQPESSGGDYFNEEGTTVRPVQDFSIKSAYDADKRRSEDEKMYGYYALPSGSKWAFSVQSDSKDLLDKVKEALNGKKRIGRSRSAQYGLAQIHFEKETKGEGTSIAAGRHYLYADSAVMLPLEIPLSEAIPNAEIDFEKSKIRTRLYQSWNTQRNTLDADRQVIEKGSVIAIDLKEACFPEVLLQHLKDRSAEGFGTILIDPPFLLQVKEKHFSALDLTPLKEKATNAASYFSGGKADDVLLSILRGRQSLHRQVSNIDEAVNRFVKEHKSTKLFRSVTASQWGTVRSMAKLFPKPEDLRRELLNEQGDRKGYLVSGIAEEKWRGGKSLIEDIVTGKGSYPDPRHLFLEKLAAEMAKQKREKEEA